MVFANMEVVDEWLPWCPWASQLGSTISILTGNVTQLLLKIMCTIMHAYLVRVPKLYWAWPSDEDLSP